MQTFKMQEWLAQRNLLLERTYAMAQASAEAGSAPAAAPNASDRRRADVESQATAWWLTDEMQV